MMWKMLNNILINTNGQIDNILINKNSGMKAEIAYSIFKKDISLSDHPFLWSKIIIGE